MRETGNHRLDPGGRLLERPACGTLGRLGWSVVVAFTAKGLVTAGLIVFATLKTLDLF